MLAMTNIRTSDPLGVNEMLYQLKRPGMETPRFYGHSPKAQEGGWRNKGEPNGAVLTLESRTIREPLKGHFWADSRRSDFRQ